MSTSGRPTRRTSACRPTTTAHSAVPVATVVHRFTVSLTAAEVAELTRAERKVDGRRVFRGVYVSRSVELTLPSVVQAALDVLPAGALASHGTAAALMGAPVEPGHPGHFTVSAA